MKSINARAFLSRSFKAEFAKTVSVVESICSALDIETVCVDRGSSSPPASEAIDKISEVDYLIALCGRDQKEETGKGYLTSQAVRDEITMAASARKPILCFVEDGVELKGFSGSMFTYKKLANFRDITNEDLFQIVHSIHEEKLKTVSRIDTIPYADGITNFYVSRSVMQVELKIINNNFVWDYSIERRYVFEEDHRTALTHSAFCIEVNNDCKMPPVWKVEIFRNGAPTTPEFEIVEEGPGKIELQSTLTPPPAKGDVLIVRERYQSPFLNITHGGQTTKRPLRINGAILKAYDGSYITNRVEHLTMRLIVPSEYALKDVQPIVSTFSNRLDHLNDSEMKRLRDASAMKVDKFFDKQTFEVSVDRPLYQYFYGLAWDVPHISDMGSLSPFAEGDWK